MSKCASPNLETSTSPDELLPKNNGICFGRRRAAYNHLLQANGFALTVGHFDADGVLTGQRATTRTEPELELSARAIIGQR